MKFKEVVLGEVCEILDTLRKPITKKIEKKENIHTMVLQELLII